MKKTIYSVMLVIISIITLSSCSNKDEFQKYENMIKSGNRINLNIWTYYNNFQATAFDKIVEEFNTTVGRSKNMVVIHTPYASVNTLAEEIENSSKKAIGSVEMPNMFQSYADDLMNLDIKYSNVAALDKYFSKNDLSLYLDGLLNEGRYDKDNSLKLIPIAKSTELFMVNKTDFDLYALEYGLELSDIKNVEDLVSFSATYFERTGKAFYGRDAIANLFYITAKTMGKDLFVIDSETNEATLNFDEEMFRKIYDNLYVPYVKGHFYSSRRFRSDDMKYGDLISYVGSTASAGYFPTTIYENDIDSHNVTSEILSVPLLSEGSRYAFLQGAGIAVTKTNEREEYASAIFLKYLADSKVNAKMAVTLEYLPVVKTALDFNLLKEEYIISKLGILEDNEVNRQTIEQKNSNTIKTYEKSINILKTYQMYTPKPFVNSAGVRRIFDCCVVGTKVNGLESLITADDLRVLINNDIASGMSKEDATNSRLEGNFDIWFNALSSAIETELRK